MVISEMHKMCGLKLGDVNCIYWQGYVAHLIPNKLKKNPNIFQS